MMKKNRSLRSLLVLSSLALAPVVAMANPISLFADFFCPGTQGAANVVINFGNYIAGYGVENTLSQSLPVYFRSLSFPGGVPRKLGNYFNQAADYDSTTGLVSCEYASSNASDPNFIVYYGATNGLGGVIQSQSNNMVSLIFPVGFKKA